MMPLKSHGRVVSLNGPTGAASNFMSNKSIIAAWLFGVLFVACATGMVAQFRQISALKLENYNLQQEKKQSQMKPEINTDDDLLARLQQIIILPVDKPTVTTVKDLENLTVRSAFLASAINGDKVMAFKDRAILYRPGEDKIVNMVGAGSLADVPGGVVSSTLPATADLTTVGETATAPVANVEAVKTLEIRNGTAKAGQAAVWKSKLTAKGYKVLTIGNAANDTYAETIVINLSGKDVSRLEQDLNLTSVTNLPTGEATSQADVLIIIGTK